MAPLKVHKIGVVFSSTIWKKRKKNNYFSYEFSGFLSYCFIGRITQLLSVKSVYE